MTKGLPRPKSGNIFLRIAGAGTEIAITARPWAAWTVFVMRLREPVPAWCQSPGLRPGVACVTASAPDFVCSPLTLCAGEGLCAKPIGGVPEGDELVEVEEAELLRNRSSSGAISAGSSTTRSISENGSTSCVIDERRQDPLSPQRSGQEVSRDAATDREGLVRARRDVREDAEIGDR